MTNSQELKEKLSRVTEEFEQYLEPWQRGLLLIALTTLLLTAIYLLTKKEKPKPRELTEEEKKKINELAETRILKRAEFLKKLRE